MGKGGDKITVVVRQVDFNEERHNGQEHIFNPYFLIVIDEDRNFRR